MEERKVNLLVLQGAHTELQQCAQNLDAYGSSSLYMDHFTWHVPNLTNLLAI